MGKICEIDGDQEQFWRMALETWQASGLSVRQFCKDEGLSEPQFYQWRRKLTGGDAIAESQDKAEPSTFIEVAIPQKNLAAMELVLTSGNTLRIPTGVDAGTLRTVLTFMHSAGLC